MYLMGFYKLRFITCFYFTNSKPLSNISTLFSHFLKTERFEWGRGKETVRDKETDKQTLISSNAAGIELKGQDLS